MTRRSLVFLAPLALLFAGIACADTGVGLTKSVILQTLDDLGVTTNGVYSGGGGGGGGDIKSDGSVAFAADESMSNHKITSLATPTVSGDASTKGYVDSYFTSQAQNKVFASPSSGSGTPTYRLLVASDLPAIPLSTVLAGGTTTGAHDISVNTGQKITGPTELTLSAANGALALRTETTQPINFVTNTSLRWAIDLNGFIIAASDNTFDFGTPDGGLTLLRPRNIYAGTLVNSPTVQAFKNTIIETTLPASSASGQANLVMDSATHQVRLSVHGGGYGTVFGDGIAAIGSKTVTVSGTPVLRLDQTWNAAGQIFSASVVDITNTASSSRSKFVDYRVSGVTKLSVDRSGNLTGFEGVGAGIAGAGFNFQTGISGDSATASSSGFNFKVCLAGSGTTYTTALAIDNLGTCSSPYQGNSQSEHFGSGSSALGGNCAFGYQASASGAFSVTYGTDSGTSGNNNAVVGYSSNSASHSCTIMGCNSVTALSNGSPRCSILGQGDNAGHADCVLLGTGITTTAAHQFIVGSSTNTITDVWIGNGPSGNAPAVIHCIAGASASGSTSAHADVAVTGDDVTFTTFTVGSADASFTISSAVNVTAYSSGTLNVKVTYTDDNNVSQTLTLPFSSLSGTSLTAIGATGPDEGIVVRIQAKASTIITLKSVGTAFTGTYNGQGSIAQIQ